MKWQDGRRSTNVEDRRGMSVGRGGAALGGGGIIIVLLISLITGRNPADLLQMLSQQQGTQVSVGQPPAAPGSPPINDKDAQLKDFVSVVLADTEDTWGPLFQKMGRTYDPPTLVLFTDEVESACGLTSAATGPFYCPGDNKLYIDLGFYQEMKDKFGAPGDFAQAYVIAHEVGHHVQNELGISRQVDRAMREGDKAAANALSVRQELQADCYAGIWGHYASSQRKLLEEGDIEEGLNAAAAIGDDRLQKMAGRRVNPESFTHGSSAQRVRWFKEGLEYGDLRRCDTFKADRL